ncbi:signal peptidase II [Agrococcus versicolor]|uniref:Lipoprotein signal peptidase n=1 Tax=Agrococcus versicolor TaxID=501482 RepID=A0ABP5MK27_9MICO
MSAARGVAWRLLGLLFGIAVAVWGVDLLVKEWVLATLPEGRPVPVLGEVLQWHFVRNPGAAFSLASGMTWIFTIIASAVAIFIVVQARRIRSRAWAIVLGALLGGVVGNLTDRLVREPGGLQGHVIDFIQVWGFPAIFNVADIFVVCSMAGFILLVLRGVGLDGVRRTDEPDAPTAGDEPAGEAAAEPTAARRED